MDVAHWRDGLRHFRARRAVGQPDDAGVSLLEVMVAMGITSIFLVMFTGAVLLISRTATRAEAVTSGGQDIATAFQRLDTSVRYAAEVQNPGQANGAWWVEYLTTSGGSKVCTQLRLTAAAQQLQQRSWTPTSGPSTPAATAWRTLAGRISNGSATGAAAPFIRPAAGTGVGYQQLSVQLVSTAGVPPVDSRSATTFTALNSAVAAKALAAGTEPTTCTQVPRS